MQHVKRVWNSDNSGQWLEVSQDREPESLET